MPGSLTLINTLAARFGLAMARALEIRKMLEPARTLNPGLETVVRNHTEVETWRMQKENLDRKFIG